MIFQIEELYEHRNTKSKKPNTYILNQIMNIHNKKLGSGYLSKSFISQAIQNGEILVAVNSNEIMGYLRYKTCSENEFYKHEGINEIYSNEKILALYTIAVKEEKLGIGTHLIDFCIKQNSNNVTKILTPLWKSKKGTNAAKLFLNFGFKKIKEYKEFWYKDSLNKTDFCPICGTPCLCNLEIYCRNIK